MALDLNETDCDILRALSDGRSTPGYLSKQTGFTRQAIQKRLKLLTAADYVERVHTGLYEITEKGKQEVNACNKNQSV